MITEAKAEPASGQSWEYRSDSFRCQSILTKLVGDTWWGIEGDGRERPFAPIGSFGEPMFSLLSDAPAAAPLAADRTGCKAWCGRTDQRPGYGDNLGGGREWQPDFRYWDVADGDIPAALVGKPMWCTGDCRDARLPPIAAQPAETKLPCHHCKAIVEASADAVMVMCAECVTAGHSFGKNKPAPQPAPAKPHDFSDPYCARRFNGNVVRLCVSCGAFDKDDLREVACRVIPEWRERYEANGPWRRDQAGTPYTGPERLERPKLAHVAGMHDDDLIGGAR